MWISWTHSTKRIHSLLTCAATSWTVDLLRWDYVVLISSFLTFSGITAPESGLTWVFAAATPLDEADDEEDEDDEGDGTHQADEPALSGYVYLVYVGWTHTHTQAEGRAEEEREREEWKQCECYRVNTPDSCWFQFTHTISVLLYPGRCSSITMRFCSPPSQRSERWDFVEEKMIVTFSSPRFIRTSWDNTTPHTAARNVTHITTGPPENTDIDIYSHNFFFLKGVLFVEDKRL